MGLLDDAIREHLDLKRRRGADPTEIERAEREALGPVRRGPEFTGEDAPAPESEAGLEPEAGVDARARGAMGSRSRGRRAASRRSSTTRRRRRRTMRKPPAYECRGSSERGAAAGHTPPVRRRSRRRLPPRPPLIWRRRPSRSPAPRAAPTGRPVRRDLDQETEEYELEPGEEEEGDDVLESTPSSSRTRQTTTVSGSSSARPRLRLRRLSPRLDPGSGP